MALKIVQDRCSNWTGYDIKIEQNKNYMQNKKKLEAFGWHVYTLVNRMKIDPQLN